MRLIMNGEPYVYTHHCSGSEKKGDTMSMESKQQFLVNVLYEAISQISKELKDSQDSQDVVLDDIKQKVSDLNETVKTIESNLLQEITQAKQVLSEVLGKSTAEILQVKESIAQLSSDLKSLQGEHGALLGEIKNNLKTLGEMNEKLSKSDNMNRWIIIAGFVILTILQFIVK